MTAFNLLFFLYISAFSLTYWWLCGMVWTN